YVCLQPGCVRRVRPALPIDRQENNSGPMAALDSITIAILLGSLLVLTGIMSSLLAMRFGAPLLLVFLGVGMLAGESGPGGLKFNDVGVAYTVGSIALALILFDGGLRTKMATFRMVMAPAGILATLGVVLTAVVTAPAAVWALGLTSTAGLLFAAIVGSTDAAAVFFLLHAKGLRLRPRVSAALAVESATNVPIAIFMTILLVEILLLGGQSAASMATLLAKQVVFGTAIGLLGGQAIILVLNKLDLPQGLH